jgi:hypothetical protein
MLRRVTLAALLALAPVVALAPAAHAATPPKPTCKNPSDECVWVYYNNAEHTTETGTFLISCSGQDYRTGTQSEFYTYSQESCATLR